MELEKLLGNDTITANLVPRVLSYPPYGTRERALRSAGRREPWERG